MARKVKVKAYPRIHFTLVDLSGITHRRYGGSGFSLDVLPVEVESSFDKSNKLEIKNNIDERDENDVLTFLEKISKVLDARFAVKVLSLPPQHVGFGSKTSLLLAIGTACNALLDNPLKPYELKQLSGRGGTSGIGINTFFKGGFIVDFGQHKSIEAKFLPSSAEKVSETPPMAIRLPFPKQWHIHLVLPNGPKYRGFDEVTFFQNNTPIPGKEVLKVLAAVYHGIVPAILESDLCLLKKALTDIHATGFKQREIQGQSSEVKCLLENLNKQKNVVAGMSSMGPLIYAITQSDYNMALEIKSTPGAIYLGTCKARNAGFDISKS
jgi:beta-ribofuranosylaminobenzene 5'-phosphate synthase